MTKLLLLAIIAGLLVFMHVTDKPVCDDLVRGKTPHELLCVYSLGDVPEDEADVTIR